jgi:hypothetical protein
VPKGVGITPPEYVPEAVPCRLPLAFMIDTIGVEGVIEVTAHVVSLAAYAK